MRNGTSIEKVWLLVEVRRTAPIKPRRMLMGKTRNGRGLPTAFGGRRARVGMAFVAGGAADFARDLSIDARPLAAFESSLHAAVFAGMKTQYSNPGTGIQAAGELAQKRVERGEFVIHS